MNNWIYCGKRNCFERVNIGQVEKTTTFHNNWYQCSAWCGKY